MTTETMEERRRYIDRIRASFPDATTSNRYRDISFSTDQEQIPVGGTLKIRLLISLLLFGAFLYCDKNQIKIGDYSVEKIYEMVEDQYPFEQLAEKLPEVFQR